MPYTRINFQNSPSTLTPINQTNLNAIQDQYSAAISDLTPQINAVANNLSSTNSEVTDLAARTTQLESNVSGLSAPNLLLEGIPLYSYGHSYTRVPSPYTTPNGGEYPVRVRNRLRMGELYARGRGGTPLLDTFSCALAPAWGDVRASEPTIDRTWTVGSRGVVLLQNYLNEINSGGLWLTQPNVDFWGVMLRSMFALLSAGNIQPASAGVETGSWADVVSVIAQACYSGTLRRSNAVANSSKSFIVSGDEAWVLTCAGTAAGTAGNLVAKCNGVTLKTLELNGIRPAYTSVVDNTLTTLTPVAIKVSGLNAAAGTEGTKTLRIEWPGVGSSAHGFIHGVMTPSATPPPIFYGLEPPRTTTNFTTGNPLYRAKVLEVAAEFPNVTVVDLAPGYDNNTMVSSLDPDNPKFHPNDLGHLLLARHFIDGINSTITAPGAGFMTL